MTDNGSAPSLAVVALRAVLEGKYCPNYETELTRKNRILLKWTGEWSL